MNNQLILLLIVIVSGIGLLGLNTPIELKQLKSNKCILPKPSSGDNPCHPPQRSITDPLVFGPHLWKALHIIAAGYLSPSGKHPPEIYRINAKKFIQSLPFMIPCGDCGFHLHEFIKTRDLDYVTRTKKNFISFFVDAHNNVTNHVNKIKVNGKLLPPKKLWTVAEAEKEYSCMDSCIKDPRVWSNAGGGLWHEIQKNPALYWKDRVE